MNLPKKKNLDAGALLCYITKVKVLVPKWRNWQTQQTQNLPPLKACRFESGLRHHFFI